MSRVADEQLRAVAERQRVILDVHHAVAGELDRTELFAAIRRALEPIATFTNLGVMIPIPELDENELYFMEDSSAVSTGRRFPSSDASLVRKVLAERAQHVVGDTDDVADYPVLVQAMRAAGVRSGVLQPLIAQDNAMGVLLLMHDEPNMFADADLSVLEEVAPAIARALVNCLSHAENVRLRAQLSEENEALRKRIRARVPGLTGQSPAMRSVRELIDTVAPTDAAVLILGETGTGKELVADRIHRLSKRSGQTLIKVNCAAIAAGVVESTLFGHEAGAFTGALTARPGRFEAADGGTLLLDEVGDLAPETQAKLLRVLESGEFERVGSSTTRCVDVRILAATNRDLHTMINRGAFRADLFHRLSVFPIAMTPLRERREDIEPLARTFVEQLSAKIGKPIKGITDEAVDMLKTPDWPGNVRELENIIERAVLLCNLENVSRRCVSHVLGGDVGESADRLDDVIQAHIEQVLDTTGWVIEGEDGAAARLGIAGSTLRSRMQKLGIQRPGRA